MNLTNSILFQNEKIPKKSQKEKEEPKKEHPMKKLMGLCRKKKELDEKEKKK